ncbi:peptidoglycan DD-metalloendopeptidase family protein [Patescibacteria group bacterium]|nr:peptidoglycan DD-metalloendopeptidase family protein [Patescibacteria group bacterium]
MNKSVIIIVMAIVVLGGAGLYFISQQNIESREEIEFSSIEDEIIVQPTTTGLALVIDQAQERIGENSFGIFKENKGYYTGVAFESFEDEQKGKEVPVYVFCEGLLVEKRFAIGYGGIAIQECILEGQTVYVLYAHMDIESIEFNIGDELAPGTRLGNLGDHESAETAGATKQLHFAIHKGIKPDIRGYVQTKEELTEWIDPQIYLKDL